MAICRLIINNQKNRRLHVNNLTLGSPCLIGRIHIIAATSTQVYQSLIHYVLKKIKVVSIIIFSCNIISKKNHKSSITTSVMKDYSKDILEKLV